MLPVTVRCPSEPQARGLGPVHEMRIFARDEKVAYQLENMLFDSFCWLFFFCSSFPLDEFVNLCQLTQKAVKQQTNK